MTWTKLGDEFSDSAAVLSDSAFRTHVEALGWSNRRLLDLLIPKRQLRRFAETDDPDTAVKELVEAGWWQDTGDSWFIGCYFPEWQRDRVQVEHRRAQEALRQQRKRRHDLDDHELCLPTSRCRADSPDSPSRRDIAGDIAGDSRRDPGRDGTGRDRTGLDVTDASPQRALGKCQECGHREPLDGSGRCDNCVAWHTPIDDRRAAS